MDHAQEKCAKKNRQQGMYALPRGPSKIVASTRRGHSRQIESFENRDSFVEKSHPGVAMSAPRPVFNGKRQTRTNHAPQDQFSPQHEECVRFLSETYTESPKENTYVNAMKKCMGWNKVMKEYDKSQGNGRDDGPEWYKEKNPSPLLKEFKPFDLEDYWGKRTMQRLTESN